MVVDCRVWVAISVVVVVGFGLSVDRSGVVLCSAGVVGDEVLSSS